VTTSTGTDLRTELTVGGMHWVAVRPEVDEVSEATRS